MSKIPISILAVIYNEKNEVLLLKRVDVANFWQSVTGSIDSYEETPLQAATREIFEETGIQINSYFTQSLATIKNLIHTQNYFEICDIQYNIIYDIYPQFRPRYNNINIKTNLEHWFYIKIPSITPIKISPTEHTKYIWTLWHKACRMCFSPSNRQAISCLFL
jgi:dATP pyrophosphohydrolase